MEKVDAERWRHARCSSNFIMSQFLLFAHIAPALPYLLAFAAGAMMYVVVEELIPESQAEPHSNIPTLGFTAGFVLMMILDVALG